MCVNLCIHCHIPYYFPVTLTLAHKLSLSSTNTKLFMFASIGQAWRQSESGLTEQKSSQSLAQQPITQQVHQSPRQPATTSSPLSTQMRHTPHSTSSYQTSVQTGYQVSPASVQHSGLPRQMKSQQHMGYHQQTIPTHGLPAQYPNIKNEPGYYQPSRQQHRQLHQSQLPHGTTGIKQEPGMYRHHSASSETIGSGYGSHYGTHGTTAKVEHTYNTSSYGGSVGGALSQEQNRKAAQEDFVCPVKNCDKSYAYNSTLLRHIRSKHSIDEIRKSGYKMTV